MQSLNAKGRYELSKAQSYYDSGLYDKALAILGKLVSKYPKVPSLYMLLGSIFSTKGDQELSIMSYSNAIKADSNKFIAYYERGLVFFGSGSFEEALRKLYLILRHI